MGAAQLMQELPGTPNQVLALQLSQFWIGLERLC